MTDEPRQVTRVIDVRMRDDYRVDRSRIERWLLPVALAQLLQALEQTSVDQHPRAISLDQVFRAGHRAGCTPE